MARSRKATGSLTVVGTGYLFGAHMTAEATRSLETADKVFHAVSDPFTEKWLTSLNPTAESLRTSYAVGKHRRHTYEEMVERMLTPVRKGMNVCTAFYGHPGVCASPTHEAIRRARKEGYDAVMLPGISAEDCLFADLNVDPSTGCQTFEATNFVTRRRKPDPSLALILWQIGLIGIGTFHDEALWNPRGLQVLTDVLRETYPARHKVTVYQTRCVPLLDSVIDRMSLSRLPKANVTIASLLYVPPLYKAPVDSKMKAMLGYD
jgi:hypothetical protein